jgi:hypothetical protein
VPELLLLLLLLLLLHVIWLQPWFIRTLVPKSNPCEDIAAVKGFGAPHI